MKISDLVEHNIVPNLEFKIPPLTDGEDLGRVNLKSGIATVYVRSEGSVIQIIAHRTEQILGFVTLTIVPNREKLAMVKNAQSYVSGESLLLNLLLWAKSHYHLRILSDYEMTSAGEAAWKALSKNNRLNVKIYNYDQDKIYDQQDPNAVLPELDTPFESDNTTWYYIIEHKSPPAKFGLYEHSYSATSLLQPCYYEDLSIPDRL